MYDSEDCPQTGEVTIVHEQNGTSGRCREIDNRELTSASDVLEKTNKTRQGSTKTRYRHHGNQTKRRSWRTYRQRCCCCVYCWWTLFHLTADSVQGYFLAMLSVGEVHVMNAGDSIVLDCSFHADSYNLFDYPVLWRKTQRDEETQINIMSNINEPFVNDGGRFEVVFTASGPSRYRLQLSISELSQKDSGNYTCEVRGPQSALLGYVTHYLFVRAPVEAVILTDGNVSYAHATSITSGTLMTSPRVIRVVENQPGSLRCVAFGGYPPPSVDVFVSGREVTSDFRFSHVAAMSGQLGLRTISYRTERWTDRFAVGAEYDAQKVKCVATVPGLRPYVEAIRLHVEYAPKISCYPTEAFNGEKNVYVRCDVAAKPRVTALFWIIDSNGTALAEGEVINGQWTLLLDRSEGLVEAQLYVRQTRPEFFRKYTIVAENNVAIATRDVELLQKFRSTTPSHGAATAGHVVSRVSLRGSVRSVDSSGCAKRHSLSTLLAELQIFSAVTVAMLTAKYLSTYFALYLR